MKKLESLSEEQLLKMQEVKQYWLDYIFSCKNQINKQSTKIGIDWMYNLAKHKSPIIIYVESPMGCQYTVHLLKYLLKNKPASVRDSVGDSVSDSVRASVWDSVGASVWASVRASVGDLVGASVWDSVGDSVGASVWDSVGDSVGASVWDSVRASVGASVGDSVRASVRDSVGDSVWDSVRDSVWDSVWASVWASVRDSVWDSVWDSVGDSVRASVRASVGDSVRASVRASVWASVRASKIKYESFGSYGNIYDYGWVSFYDFFTQIGVINHEKYNQFKALIQSGIYDTIQLNGFCIMSNMPDKIKRNRFGRLHAENESAIHFRDGYELFFWNGVSVPQNWIMDKNSITKDVIMKESNAEKRRCLREILGAKKYYDIITDGQGLKLLDEDTDNQGNAMRLYETNQPDSVLNKKVQFLECVCPSTLRVYNIYPPRQNSKNVWQAKADTFGKTEKEFNPVLES